MHQVNLKNKQSGTAIFMALMVVSIVTAMSIVWFTQTSLAIRRTQEIIITEQTYLYAQGVIAWGVNALKINTTVPKILPNTLIAERQGNISGRIDQYKPKKSDSMVTTKQVMASGGEDYFLLRTEVHLSKQHLLLYSLLHRTLTNGKVQITIIWQGHALI